MVLNFFQTVFRKTVDALRYVCATKAISFFYVSFLDAYSARRQNNFYKALTTVFQTAAFNFFLGPDKTAKSLLTFLYRSRVFTFTCSKNYTHSHTKTATAFFFVPFSNSLIVFCYFFVCYSRFISFFEDARSSNDLRKLLLSTKTKPVAFVEGSKSSLLSLVARRPQLA